MVRNPYQVLGVASEAPDFVIRAAYRACLKHYHPDHHEGADAERRTAEIIEAFRILSDPGERRAIDERLRWQAQAVRAAAPCASGMPPAGQHRPRLGQAPGRGGFIWGVAGTLVAAVASLAWFAGRQETLLVRSTTASLVVPGDESPPAKPAALPVADSSSAVRLPPNAALDFVNLERGVRAFAQVFESSGMRGAREYSESCHARQAAQPSWPGRDFCAAFDFAAASFDRVATPAALSRNAFFAFQEANQADHYGPDAGVVSARLEKIRAAVSAALWDVWSGSRPVPVEARFAASLDPGTANATALSEAQALAGASPGDAPLLP